MEYDEIKNEFRLLVVRKKYGEPKLAKVALIVFELAQNEMGYRMIENLKNYNGVVGMNKWYLTAFIPHMKSYVNRKFPFNNYS